MTTVSVTQLNANDEITAAGANLPHNQLAAVINGNLDDNNISSLSGTKITTGTLPTTALDSTVKSGWLPITGSISAVTYNGNRSYSLTTSSDNSGAISPGMRLRTTRTVSAPTQVASLNGTNNYFSKTSPTNMAFTDDFTVSAWVKLTSYASGTIVSRYSGTTGWSFYVNSNGTIGLGGYTAGGYRRVNSYQSLPLNKWVHVAATLDMSGYTYTSDSGATNNYVMMDGIAIPGYMDQSGTNPTALTVGGNLEIGSANASGFFTGKIAQVAVYNARVTAANIRATISQGLVGTETSLVSAYSFNNSITDLNTTNANNLTNNNSTSITNADSPFGYQADGSISATKDYAIVQTVSASTLVVQVPDGCAIPTNGGISAVAYSVQKSPYGFPGQRGKWELVTLALASDTTSSPTSGTWVEAPTLRTTLPIGEWNAIYLISGVAQRLSSGNAFAAFTHGTTSAAETDIGMTSTIEITGAVSGAVTSICTTTRQKFLSASTQTVYYVNYKAFAAGMSTVGIFNGDGGLSKVSYENAYL